MTALDPEVKQQFHDLLEKLKAAGHTVESVDFTYLDYLVPHLLRTDNRSIVPICRLLVQRHPLRSSQRSDRRCG